MTVFSTTSQIDLNKLCSDSVVFTKNVPQIEESQFLKYPSKWFLTTKDGGCSCGFRYVERWNIELLGFSEPQDWSPEDQEDIFATHEIYKVITSVLETGESIDSVTAWVQDEGASHELFGDLEVNISEINIERFRLFDAYRFQYCKT